MSINTTHNGHEIGFDESEDTWYCRELELKAKSLSSLKQKINDVDNAERRINGKTGLKFLYLPSYGWGREEAKVVTATLLEGNGSAVWVKDGSGRKKVGVHELIEDTPDNREKVKQAAALDAQAKELTEQASKLRKSIQRLTIDRLKALNLETKPA